jgi:glutamine amidotransferase-like uncharacterized protein
MKLTFSLPLLLLLLAGVGVVGATAAAPAPAVVETLAASTQPGPTVLLLTQAAEGDVSGAVALRQVARWPLTRGRVVTAPAAEAATAVAAMMPDAVVLLTVQKSTAKTVPPATVQVRGGEAAALLASLNTLLDPGTAPLVAAAGARASRIPAAVAEAIELRFPLQRGAASPGERTRLFRHAVHAVLAARGMITASPWELIDRASPRIKVAVYAGGGSATTPGLAAYPASLDTAAREIDYTYVGPVELARPGTLDPFDVVVFCGGSGSGQAKAIGEAGAAQVKAFVQRGGGYVSSCAGSYLATSGYPWSLRLIAADTVDSKHWARGTGQVDIELTAEGRKILGDFRGLQSVLYANGPLLGPARDPGTLAPYTVLAHFRSDMAKKVPGGVMPNTPAMIAGDYGAGRVLCFSPHPEYSESLRGMIVRAVKWTARRPLEAQ